MNKFKFLALITPLAIVSSVVLFSSSALADYTTEINGQVVYVTYVVGSASQGAPEFNLYTVNSSGEKISLTGNTPVKGAIVNGRGVPTLTGINTGLLAGQTITPPANQGVNNVTDSNTVRTNNFCQSVASNVCGTNGLLQGYSVSGGGTNLAVDQTTDFAQVIVVAARAAGILSINQTTGANWSSLALGLAQTKQLEQQLGLSGNQQLTATQANAIFAKFGVTNFNAAATGPGGTLTRADLFNAIGGSSFGTGGVGGGTGTGTGGTGGTGSGGTGVTPTPTPTPYCVFGANRTRILINQSSTLTWSCYNLDSCTMTPNPTTGTGTKTVAISGSASVQPQANTTYILNCTGPFGSTSATTVINVYRTSIQESSPTSFLGNVKNWVANNLGLGVGTANAQ